MYGNNGLRRAMAYLHVTQIHSERRGLVAHQRDGERHLTMPIRRSNMPWLIVPTHPNHTALTTHSACRNGSNDQQRIICGSPSSHRCNSTVRFVRLSG